MELDRTLLPILAETLSDYDNVEIVPGDILKTDIAALCRERMPGLPVVACANLPYNITTPVITALLQAQCFQAVTVMIQREVARRICAKPGTGDYGAFSVFCQYHTAPELLFDVPPECFIPAPKVTSSVLRVVPRPARRRWMTRSTSSGWCGPPLPSGGRPGQRTARRLWGQADQGAAGKHPCGLRSARRRAGERLGIAEFAGISRKIRQTQADFRRFSTGLNLAFLH